MKFELDDDGRRHHNGDHFIRDGNTAAWIGKRMSSQPDLLGAISAYIWIAFNHPLAIEDGPVKSFENNLLRALERRYHCD